MEQPTQEELMLAEIVRELVCNLSDINELLNADERVRLDTIRHRRDRGAS